MKFYHATYKLGEPQGVFGTINITEDGAFSISHPSNYAVWIDSSDPNYPFVSRAAGYTNTISQIRTETSISGPVH